MPRIATYCLLLFVSSSYCFAQNSVYLVGQVKDSIQPIPYPTITVYKDSVFIQRQIGDSVGRFSFRLSTGTYMLQASSIGHRSYLKNISALDSLYLEIILTDTTTLLAGVTVTAQKKLIEYKVDRIVFNVENSIYSRGLDVVDLLRETPRVEVTDDGSIKMIGKSDLRVMIDGRPLNLSENDVKQRLKALRSDDIAKIEVISIPPANYSAQGNSGYINIVLKKNPNLGWQGSINIAYLQRSYPSFSEATTINYKSKFFEATISISNDNSKLENIQNTQFKFSERDLNISRHSLRNEHTSSVNSILKWKPIQKLETGLVLDYSYRKASNNDIENSTYSHYASSTIDSMMHSPSQIREKPLGKGLSAYIDYRLDDKGKKLSLTYNLSENTNDLNKLVSSEITTSSARSKISQFFGNSNYNINSVMADAELPTSFSKIETGMSYTQIKNYSALETYNKIGGQNVYDSSISNRFRYTEKTPALYISANKNIGDKWAVKVGFRYEYTGLKGVSPTLSLTNKDNYGNIFPSLFVLYNISKNHVLNLAYARRIERPGFNDLNPFRYYSSAYSYVSGNAYLLPSFTNNVDIGYTYKNNLALYLSYVQLSDGIDYVALIHPDGTNSVTPENYVNQRRYVMNLSYTLKFTERWNLYGSATTFYANSRSERPDLHVLPNKGFGATCYIRNSVALNKKNTAFWQTSYYQSFPSMDGFNEKEAFAYFSSNVRFSIAKDLIQIMVSALDIFKQNYTVTKRHYSDYVVENYFNAKLQNFRISVNLNLGNSKVSRISRDTKNTDRFRAM